MKLNSAIAGLLARKLKELEKAPYEQIIGGLYPAFGIRIDEETYELIECFSNIYNKTSYSEIINGNVAGEFASTSDYIFPHGVIFADDNIYLTLGMNETDARMSILRGIFHATNLSTLFLIRELYGEEAENKNV